MTVALPPPEDRAFADVWSALGGELKPSLDVVVSAPVDAGKRYPAGPPVREGMQVDFGDLDGEQADGRVRKHRPEPPAEPTTGRPAMTRTRRRPQ